MNRKIVIPAAAIALTVLAAAVSFGARWYTDNRAAGFTNDYTLFVYPDTPLSEVVDSISAGAVPLRPRSLARSFAKENVEENIKPGRYVIPASKPTVYVARMLTHGWQTPANLVLSGTLRTKERLAKLISLQMMVDSTTVADALRSDDFLAPYGFRSDDVFGLILPDTYEMYWTASIEDIFERFRKEYDAFWTSERLAKAEKLGMTPAEVTVMASIVNGETRAEKEYATIAGVYMNRYHKGMRLQADPTICYIYGYKINRVLKSYLDVESPYNTYKYAGLPPTPINVVRKKCIDAVLDYEVHDYLYFCANSAFDGTHKFAKNYSEHLENARDFQRALNARNIKK
ncbi:MAG: endolytic transglycosylase MltG [Bacteroidales bacterium]|nr:endolytic transglycosylase MltG [Bacteroidales bacterium]